MDKGRNGVVCSDGGGCEGTVLDGDARYYTGTSLDAAAGAR